MASFAVMFMLGLLDGGASVRNRRTNDNKVGLEYEIPKDEVPAQLDDWMLQQEWRQFTSRFGKPDSRNTLDVNLKFVKIAVAGGTKGALIVSPGLKESALFYSEFVHDYVKRGYSPIYILDQRGMGFSDRILSDPHKIYVEKWTDLVADFSDFVDLVMDDLQNSTLPKFMLCHSMGCLVAFQYMKQEYLAQRTQQFQSVAAISPLVKPDFSPVSFDIGMIAASAACAIGSARKYNFAGETDFNKIHEPYGEDLVTKSRLSHSRTRLQLYMERCMNWEALKVGNDEHRGICMVEPTYRMAEQLGKMYKDLKKFWKKKFWQKERNNKFTPPMLILGAGPATGSDGYVLAVDQDEFCSKACARCSLSRKPDSKHVIHNEIESIRTPALNELDQFFQGNRDILYPNPKL